MATMLPLREPAALAEVRRGRPVILVGAPGSTEAGHVVAPASATRASTVNLMAREAGGIVCVALTDERCRALGLRPVHAGRCAHTSLIEARSGVTTGISAGDRAHTIRVAGDPSADADALVRPGHVLPLCVESGRVRSRLRIAEAAVELVTLAGHPPAAALCGVLDAAGDVADVDALRALGLRLGLSLIGVDDVAELCNTTGGEPPR